MYDSIYIIGPDGIHPRIVEECKTTLAITYAKLFQTSLGEGKLPKKWEESTISPKYKGGSRTEVASYRPVHLTCVPCKAMKRMIKKQIIEHVTNNKLLNQAQHGFLPKRSCLTNLLQYLDSLTTAVDQGATVYSAYLDLSKAFDVLPHHKLTACLKESGIGGG